MNRQQEQEAIEILLAGNALDDLRALVRNAPREHSLRAMLEFLEGTHEYVAKVMAFIRALEPTIAAKRPELAGPPSVKFRGDRIVISAEQLAAMGKKLPPDRPKGDAVIECSGGVYYWVEVPSDD